MLAVAVAFAIMFVGGNLPTPLYVIYKQEFDFSDITLTLIFAAYVAGTLTTLFLFGRISDQVGRRWGILPAVALAALSTLTFLLAESTAMLFVGRVLSGLAVAMSAAACTAWIAELDPDRDRAGATTTAAIANMIGLGLGPLLAGVLAEFAPWPLQLSYLVFLPMLVLAAVLAWRAPETVKRPVRRIGDLELRPRLGVPPELRAAFMPAAVTAFVAFGLLGFYSALTPSLLKEVLWEGDRAVGGAIVFAMFAAAAGALALTRGLDQRTVMLTGLLLLPPSVATLVAAGEFRSLPLLLVSSLAGGVSAALAFRGSLQVVNQIAPEDRRAEVVSTYLLFGYVGVSVPVIGIGVLSHFANPVIATFVFAVVIGLCALAALATGYRSAPSDEDAVTS
jgi:MFS family permease